MHIGSYAFVGGASAINKDIVPFSKDKVILINHELNTIGMVRKGFSNETIAKIKEIYNLFYRSGLNISQAMEKALQILILLQNRLSLSSLCKTLKEVFLNKLIAIIRCLNRLKKERNFKITVFYPLFSKKR